MNIYFPPAKNNELSFPVSNLSTNITESFLTADDLKKANSDIDDIINENDNSDLIHFYKKYKSKKFEKTTVQKKLNKIKVYFIVKTKIIKGKEVNFAVPIRSYDDLGHSIIERSKGFIASVFYVRLDIPQHEGRTASRPFILDNLLATAAPFDSKEEITLKELILPRDYDIEGVLLPLKGIITPDDISEYGYFDDSFGGEYIEEYDYKVSMIDNTFLSHVSRYTTDIRYKKNLDGEPEKPTFSDRIQEIKQKGSILRVFTISNILSILLSDNSALKDKGIIPVFSKLEDAQDLLITTLEELNQPFQVRRQIESANTPKYYRSLDYLDDSFSFQNRYFLPNMEDRGAVITDFLRRYRLIKARNTPSYEGTEYYSEDEYQTKGPFYVEDIDTNLQDGEYVPAKQRPKFAPKNVWRESDYLDFLRIYFPGQAADYSWLETRDLTKADKGLLKKSQDIKIVSMGLGDFFEFWNNPTPKNAEVLFIPSSEKLNKIKLPLLPKKPRDKFYDYQKKFRGDKKEDSKNYSYEIKISS